MLVLSRHTNEVVVITTPQGDKIEVVLVELRGDKARLGFEAEPHIKIHRKEVQNAIERANKEKSDGQKA